MSKPGANRDGDEQLQKWQAYYTTLAESVCRALCWGSLSMVDYAICRETRANKDDLRG